MLMLVSSHSAANLECIILLPSVVDESERGVNRSSCLPQGLLGLYPVPHPGPPDGYNSTSLHDS